MESPCVSLSVEGLHRHQICLLAQDVPAWLNGLLDIDLTTQKEELSSYPI